MLTEQDVRRIIRDELRHSNLRGMPDYGGFNADHDGRYVQLRGKAVVSEVVLPSLALEPNDPVEGTFTMWLSDGTNVGAEPSLMFKITWDGTTYIGYIPTVVEMPD